MKKEKYLSQKLNDEMRRLISDIEDAESAYYKLEDAIDDIDNESAINIPENLAEWVDVCIELLPNNIDLGTAISAEEMLKNFLKGSYGK